MTRIMFSKENLNDMLFGAAVMLVILWKLPRPQDVANQLADQYSTGGN